MHVCIYIYIYVYIYVFTISISLAIYIYIYICVYALLLRRSILRAGDHRAPGGPRAGRPAGPALFDRNVI